MNKQTMLGRKYDNGCITFEEYAAQLKKLQKIEQRRSLQRKLPRYTRTNADSLKNTNPYRQW